MALELDFLAGSECIEGLRPAVNRRGMEEHLDPFGNAEEPEATRAVQARNRPLQVPAGMLRVWCRTCGTTFTASLGMVVDLFMFATDLGIGVFWREILSGVGSVFAHGSW